MKNILLFILFLAIGTVNSQEKINWITMNEALAAQKKEPKKIFMDVYTTWCGPCKMIGPIVEEIAGDYDGKAVIGKVDVDSNPEVAAKFGIRSIPTLLFFKGGEIVDKQVGAVPKAVLAQKLDAQL